MKIYFVRHGESRLNADGTIHQSSDTPLSEPGLKQAQEFAGKAKGMEIKRLFSSPYTRAKLFAEETSKKIGVPVEELELLKERKRPSKVEGKKYDDPEAVKIKKIIRENYTDPAFRHSDEETFTDLKERARNILRFFEDIEESPLLAVTHEHILILLMALLLLGEDLDAEQYVQMDKHFEIENAALIACEYNKGQWKVTVPKQPDG